MTLSKFTLLAVAVATLTGCVEDTYYATQTSHPRAYYTGARHPQHVNYEAVSTPVPPRNNYPRSAVSRQVPVSGYRSVPATADQSSAPPSDFSGPVAAPSAY
jgi:hypothetical protein